MRLRSQLLSPSCVDFADQYLIKIESSENRKHPWSGKSDADAEKIFAKTYPAIYEYLTLLRSALIERYDQGKYFWELRGCVYWHEFKHPKVLYPDIYEHQSFTWDEEGFFAANTCYFIPTEEKWLTALLNSQAIEWFYSQVSNKVRGGYMRAFSDYMRLIPIPQLSKAQRDVVERLVDYLLWLHRPGSTPSISQMPGYFEQLLNGLIYELFFPEAFHAQKLYIFRYTEEAKLPALAGIPATKRLAVLHETFERIYDLNHPIRGCLFSLGALETVRIIGGEA